MNKLKKIYTFFLLYAFCFALFAPAQSQNVISGEKGKKINELVNAYYREGLLNGTILVAERGKVIYKRGFGFANMEFKVPNEPNTKFRVASISKSIAAILAMRLVEQGKLSLDAKVSDYLPDYRKDVADKVTVRHLLSHTSGIPDTLTRPGLWEREIRDPFTPQELLARYSNGTLEFEPGTKFKYGTMAYVLLSLIIEKATGRTFEQAQREEVLEPLEMRDTGIEGASPIVVRNEQGRSMLKGKSPIIERMATGYMKVNNEYSRSPFMDMTHAYAGGTIYSTVEDLFRLDRALYNDKFISKQTREKMFTPVLSDTGLGWNTRYLSFSDLQQPFLNIVDEPRMLREAPADFKVVYKLGDLWGYSGVFARLPNEEHTIAVLVNVNSRAIFFELETIRVTQGLMNILYDKPYFTPRERTFAEIIERQGFEKAVEIFKQLKQKEPANPVIREAEVNALGYEILGQKKFALAIDVFKLNVEAYPKSANSYDSLAETYLGTGEKELALKLYKKALEVDPNYPNAKAAAEIVKKLEADAKVNSSN